MYSSWLRKCVSVKVNENTSFTIFTIYWEFPILEYITEHMEITTIGMYIIFLLMIDQYLFLRRGSKSIKQTYDRFKELKYFILIFWNHPKINKTQKAQCYRDYEEKARLVFFWWHCKLVMLLVESSWQLVLKVTQLIMVFKLVIPLFRLQPEETAQKGKRKFIYLKMLDWIITDGNN